MQEDKGSIRIVKRFLFIRNIPEEEFQPTGANVRVKIVIIYLDKIPLLVYCHPSHTNCEGHLDLVQVVGSANARGVCIVGNCKWLPNRIAVEMSVMAASITIGQT